MSDLTDRIRNAQIVARENAAINGGDIRMAGIIAGENAVVEDLRRKEAAAVQKSKSHLSVVGGTDTPEEN